jgi:glycosyltransferase involved in cell wall biosynthesis
VKILSITAGAAGMYCGSCFRDNALAVELIAQGHDVSLVPVYTPTRTDEPNVSQPQVLFGGISVYLQQRFRLFRRVPRALDRLWDSPSLIRAFAARAETTDPRLLGALTISMLRGEAGVLKKEFEKLVDWARAEPLPDVINLPNSLLIAMAKPLRAALARPVCCTLQGEELFLDGLPPPFRDEAIALIRRQAGDVDRFLAVSDYCARFMADLLAIPAGRISVVPLGINMAGYGARPARPNGFVVGYLARIAPEKGLHVLADAFARFCRLAGRTPARLEAAGYLAPAHHGYLAGVRRRLEAEGLGDRFTYHGEVDRAAKIEFLRRLDVLSVPATYDEPKGLFLLEAMAAGVPVVQPRRGAFVEIVEQTGGGLLVAPDDPAALADGLLAVCRDRELAAGLSVRALEGVRASFTIQQSARRLVDVYDAVVAAQALPRVASRSAAPVA